MLSTSTINYNRPTMSVKISFYNMLVLYYNMNEKFGKTNEMQKQIGDKISLFGSDNTQTWRIGELKVFDIDTINRLRPLHKRKAKFYNLLVAYADYGRFDVFEQFLKCIKEIRNSGEMKDECYTLANLLGFGEAGDVIEYFWNHDELLGDAIFFNEDTFVCPVSIVEQVKKEVAECEESKEKEYTLEIVMKCTKKEMEEFVAFLEEGNKCLKRVNYYENK